MAIGRIAGASINGPAISAEYQHMPDRSWTLLASELLSDHRVFRVHADLYRLEPAGAEHQFYKLDAPDWVNIIPLTADNRVIMVRQYRHGVAKVTLEVPGGMVDPGESPREAAVREMQEETGYGGGRVRELGWVWPNPAIQTNKVFTFVAEGVERLAEPQPEAGECIEVLTVPLADVPRLMRSGEISHALVVVAFAHIGLVPAQAPAGR